MFPKNMILDKRLRDIDVRLLSYFHFVDMNMCGLTMSTNTEIANELKKSTSTIKKSIDRLIEFEYLHIDKDLMTKVLGEEYKRVLISRDSYLQLMYSRDKFMKHLERMHEIEKII